MDQHFAHGRLELSIEDGEEEGDGEECEGGGGEDYGLGDSLAGVIDRGQGEGESAVFISKQKQWEEVFMPGQDEVECTVGE